ncbi:MAG: hypothetical protein E6J35_10270, partial [Chloroflexi bacterium]
TTTPHAAGAVNVIVTNADTQSGTCSGCFTYVAPAPTVASVTPNSGATAGGTSVTVAGTGFGAGANVSFGGSALTVATIAATSITGTTTAHAAGSVNVVVTNTDTQSGTCTGCFTYLAPAPIVSSLAPTSGPAVGGTSVTITGTNFQSGATASLGGSPVTVSSVTGTSITGTTTAHAAGAASVTVTNPDAQSGTCTGCFTYVAAPTVTSVTPSSGASAGGTAVTLAGTGFVAGATVSFGGSALTVSTISATSITGSTTAHAAGAVTVTVTNPDTQSGTCIVCFTYTAPPPPTVTSVTPNSGASAGGSAVTVSGTGFQSGATVSFGGSTLTVSTISATSITGTTTAHAVGAVTVTVTNPEAQSGTCSACFTYLGPAPTVSSVTPNSGASAGGTAVTIAGTDFQAGATVSFGGSALTVSTISATSITGTTTSHAAGAVNVVVTNTDTQSGTCTGCFTYVAPASVTLRATSTGTGTNTYVVPKPAGLSANDVMVASLSANGANTMTPPSGWTLIAHTQGVSVVDLWTYYRVAGPSEPASYTWTASSSATGVAGIAAYHRRRIRGDGHLSDRIRAALGRRELRARLRGGQPRDRDRERARRDDRAQRCDVLVHPTGRTQDRGAGPGAERDLCHAEQRIDEWRQLRHCRRHRLPVGRDGVIRRLGAHRLNGDLDEHHRHDDRACRGSGECDRHQYRRAERRVQRLLHLRDAGTAANGQLRRAQ